MSLEPGTSAASAAGPGTQTPFNNRLYELPDGTIQLAGADNTIQDFDSLGGGQYSSTDNNTAAILTRSGSGATDQISILSRDGTIAEFYGTDAAVETPGWIKSITDRFGNRESYVWDSDQRLQALTDRFGRTTTYTYYGSEYNDQLKESEDWVGNKTTYQYDSDGRLIAVIGPAVTKGAEDAELFPNGTAYVYQYDVNNPRPERRYDLLRVWHPNEATPYIQVDADGDRTVDVDAVYADAKPRITYTYGQDPTDEDTWGRVLEEIHGDPKNGVGGTYYYEYQLSNVGLPISIFFADSPTDPVPENEIATRTIVTDPNGNRTIYDLSPDGMPVRTEVQANRGKNSLEADSYVTWTKYNANNQEVLVIYPEGNSVEYQYESGNVSGFSEPYARRIGLLLRETRRPCNDYGIPCRLGHGNGSLNSSSSSSSSSSSDGIDQELTRRYFYDPLFNQQCAMIEERGNPVDTAGTYFPPQNLGPTPTDSDRSRYATINYMDYQQDTLNTVKNDADLQAWLGLTAAEIEDLIDHVNSQMVAGGLPAGFEMDLGDINGDGTGDGASSGKPASRHAGNVVRIKHPAVRMIEAA